MVQHWVLYPAKKGGDQVERGGARAIQDGEETRSLLGSNR